MCRPRGITKITDTDFKYAAKLGTSIKLFGTSRMEGNKASVYVCPMMIRPDHPLFAVNDVYNAVMVRGNTLGTVMFYGSGAGKLPTASAVVSDIVEIAGHMEDNIPTGWIERKTASCTDGRSNLQLLPPTGRQISRQTCRCACSLR